MSKNHPFKHNSQSKQSASNEQLTQADIQRQKVTLGRILLLTDKEIESFTLAKLQQEYNSMLKDVLL